MASAVSRHQANREHLEGHGLEQGHAMALADVIEGLTAEVKASNRELTAEIEASNRRLTDEVWLTCWMDGIAAGFAGVAAAGTVAMLAHLLFAQA